LVILGQKAIMCFENLEEAFDGSQAAVRLTQLFDSQWLESQARSSHFIQRSSSRITGQMFLMINVLELSSSPDDNLQNQCNWLSTHFEVEIKKQSLNDRYNTHGGVFPERLPVIGVGQVDGGPQAAGARRFVQAHSIA